MNYRNAKQISGNRINCEIDHPTYGWIPFTCDPTDNGAAFNVATLYAEMAADPFTAAYIPPTQAEIDAAQAKTVCATRDAKLTMDVDPIVTNPLRWGGMTAEQQAAWATYRQALLDISQQAGFPYNVAWPIKPE